MKILQREEFLCLPSGVLYAKFKPCVFDEVCMKGETIGEDFSFQRFIEIDTEKSDERHGVISYGWKEGGSIPLTFELENMDGFPQHQRQLFAVFEKEEVCQLLLKLQETLEFYPSI